MEPARMILLSLAVGLVLLAGACALGQGDGSNGSAPSSPPDPHLGRRLAMVRSQIEARGVSEPRVLQALRKVERHRFVPPDLAGQAYDDRPLPIGQRQTISQPYIVALMTELANPGPDAKVLEVGTGSGYQAAVLAELAREVYSIEIVPELGRAATALLEKLGYANVHTRVGDGFDGWPEQAPFDCIVVTASPPEIPRPLLEQLAPGGRLVIPVGSGSQDLEVVIRTEDGYQRRTVIPVRFVPMTGKAQEPR